MAEEPSFDSARPLATAFTLSAYHEVESQPLRWRPLTRCEGYVRQVHPTGKKEDRRKTASSVAGTWEKKLRLQKKLQNSCPAQTRANLEADCLKMLRPLPESVYSRISAWALEVSTSFSIPLFRPPKEGFSPPKLRA